MNKSDKTFYCPETDQEYDLKEIKDLDPDTQKNVMRNWFYSNYENPAEHTPFESKEGGYLYIWGGPFDAREELEDIFLDYVPKEALDDLVSELESESLEWSGKISSEGYDEYLYTVIYDNYEFTETLKSNLNSIKKLIKINLPPELEQHMNKMLFVNVITSLETFLSDAFIGTVLKDKQLLKDFVRLNPDFSDRKFSLNEIFERIDTIEKEVKKYLLDLIWHNLAKAQQMYHSVLHIDFPEDMNLIYKGIAIRHDIVHRNGKTKSGKNVTVTRDELIKLMDKVNSFAETIDDYFNV
ncbi:MAG: HEPN domain-containing protein [Elusimicrobiota bacterium]